MKILKTLILIVLFQSLALSNGVKAESPIHDTGLWAPITIEAPITKKASVVWFTEPRLGNDYSHLDRLLLLGNVAYKVNPHLTLGVGGGTHLFDKHAGKGYIVENENFIFEQANTNFKLSDIGVNGLAGELKVSNRFRLEQRSVDHSNEVRFRFRPLVKLSYPLGTTKKFYLYASEEAWIPLNPHNKKEPRGFELLISSVGAGMKVNKYFTIEAGYQPVLFNKRGTGNILQHNIVTNVTVLLPQLIK